MALEVLGAPVRDHAHGGRHRRRETLPAIHTAPRGVAGRNGKATVMSPAVERTIRRL
jgi:hypothetical protein